MSDTEQLSHEYNDSTHFEQEENIDQIQNTNDSDNLNQKINDENVPDDTGIDEDAAIRSMPSFKKKRPLDDSAAHSPQTPKQRSAEYSDDEGNRSGGISVHEDENENSDEYNSDTNRKKKSKKSSKRYSNSEENSDAEKPLDPKALAILELNKDIDFALKRGKASRRRKNAEISTDQDEEIQRMQEKMRNAADADFEDNKSKLPAIHKIQLLKDVSSLLAKPHLYESLLENNILDTIRLWLEPLDDGSLPNIDIQNALLMSMTRLPIQSDHLRDSGIGKIVLFMSKCNRYPERHRRIADQLVQRWARPILRRSSNFRDKVLDESRENRSSQTEDPSKTNLFGRVQVQSGNSVGGHSFHASIPFRVSTNYNIMPKSSVNPNSASNGANAMPEKFKRIRAHMQKGGRR
ncbi:Transcription factor IWS1 [Smittium culicis]|uniref:Transcription factor IWS1 n=1 Tax=Smittium culicis TaxID=133412 RepID=A0A1R1Y2C9_9FUNG|nr:Transcription factor IWS1 [Smittium culicis]